MPFTQVIDPEIQFAFTQNSDCKHKQFTKSLAANAKPEGVYNGWDPVGAGISAVNFIEPLEISCPLCGKCPIIVKYWVSKTNETFDNTPDLPKRKMTQFQAVLG